MQSNPAMHMDLQADSQPASQPASRQNQAGRLTATDRDTQAGQAGFPNLKRGDRQHFRVDQRLCLGDKFAWRLNAEVVEGIILLRSPQPWRQMPKLHRFMSRALG